MQSCEFESRSSLSDDSRRRLSDKLPALRINDVGEALLQEPPLRFRAMQRKCSAKASGSLRIPPEPGK